MRKTSILLLLSLLLAPTLVWAQKGREKADPNVRTLEGIVTDAAKNPVKGAVVQLKDTRTLQVRSFFTQDNGEYNFSGLRKDTDYEVKATFQDQASDTKRLSIYDTRDAPRIILELQKK
jgi:hypothetical protein